MRPSKLPHPLGVCNVCGTLTNVHVYVNGSPSTSNEPEPFRLAVAPTATVWFAPAFATGGEFTVLILTLRVSCAAPLSTVKLTT